MPPPYMASPPVAEGVAGVPAPDASASAASVRTRSVSLAPLPPADRGTRAVRRALPETAFPGVTALLRRTAPPAFDVNGFGGEDVRGEDAAAAPEEADDVGPSSETAAPSPCCWAWSGGAEGSPRTLGGMFVRVAWNLPRGISAAGRGNEGVRGRVYQGPLGKAGAGTMSIRFRFSSPGSSQNCVSYTSYESSSYFAYLYDVSSTRVVTAICHIHYELVNKY